MSHSALINWERTVIGTVLSDPDAYEEARASDLMAQDFSQSSHQAIWHEIHRLERAKALSLNATRESLRENGSLDTLGIQGEDIQGEPYLDYVMLFNDPLGYPEAVRKVVDATVKRQLRTVAALIAADARTDKDAGDLVHEAITRLYTLRHTRVDGGVSIGEIINVFMPRMHAMRSGEIQPAWVPRLPQVRSIIDYVDRKDYVVIAGRPGMGKSSYMRWEAIKACGDGMHILTINLENDELEYAKFGISLLTGIDSALLKSPRGLRQSDLERIQRAAEDLSTMPWKIRTIGGPSVREIERIATVEASKDNLLGMIQVDYLQLIRNGRGKTVDDVTESSQGLRALAMNLGIPVMAAAQLSRNIEYRGDDAEPELADLRESGSIEQDATIVIFINKAWGRPSPEQIAAFPENIDFRTRTLLPIIRAMPVRFYVRKNRNGPIGVSDAVKFLKPINDFQSMDVEVT